MASDNQAGDREYYSGTLREAGNKLYGFRKIDADDPDFHANRVEIEPEQYFYGYLYFRKAPADSAEEIDITLELVTERRPEKLADAAEKFRREVANKLNVNLADPDRIPFD